METLTEKEYKDILEKNDELVKLIIEKTREMAFIAHGRYPEGVCDETDFEEKDGKLMVQFETWYCQESNYETYYLPLEFLFDEKYPEKYAKIFKKEKEEKIKRQREDELAFKKRLSEETERCDVMEYERLKAKFGI